MLHRTAQSRDGVPYSDCRVPYSRHLVETACKIALDGNSSTLYSLQGYLKVT